MLGRRPGRVPAERVVADGRTGVSPRHVLPKKLIDVIRRIAGMPDYQAYLDHLRRCHPDTLPLTDRQFYDEFIRARYGDGPTRCC
jgi:uncharacterized short protein YbdD (DUF466 family)